MTKEELKGLVLVEWDDHYHIGGWNREPQPTDPVRIISVGWVVEEDKKMLVISESKCFQDGDRPNGVGQLRGIIKSTITKRQRLA